MLSWQTQEAVLHAKSGDVFGEAKSCWDGELTMMFWVVLFSSIETICSTVFPPPKKSRIWIFATSSCLDVLYLYVFTLLFEIAMVWKQIHFPSHRFCYGKFRGYDQKKMGIGDLQLALTNHWRWYIPRQFGVTKGWRCCPKCWWKASKMCTPSVLDRAALQCDHSDLIHLFIYLLSYLLIDIVHLLILSFIFLSYIYTYILYTDLFISTINLFIPFFKNLTKITETLSEHLVSLISHPPTLRRWTVSPHPQTQISLLCNTRHIATFRAAAETDVILWAKQPNRGGFHWVFGRDGEKNAQKLEKIEC